MPKSDIKYMGNEMEMRLRGKNMMDKKMEMMDKQMMDKQMMTRPQGGKAMGMDRTGSVKGDVGMSPRSTQGPGNMGDFTMKRARKNGVIFKGDPMRSKGYA